MGANDTAPARAPQAMVIMATKAIVGEKVGMTQVWDEENRVVPVTVLRITPVRIVQVKTTERDGYSALQVTFGHKDAKKLTKPQAGHFAKAGVQPGRRVVELRLDSVDGFEVIDAQKLTDLDSETLVAWHRRGWLSASYLHLISLNRVGDLIARAA